MGTILNEVKYTAFGEIRSGSGDMPTKYQYTGQLSQMAEIGLYHYGARFYDKRSLISHFVSADTMVPRVGNVMDWNRYSYVRYNSVKYTDPSGHIPACEENCAEQRRLEKAVAQLGSINFLKQVIKNSFGITASDNGNQKWNVNNLAVLNESLTDINRVMNGKFKSVAGGATLKLYIHTDETSQYRGSTHLNGSGIDFYIKSGAALRQMNVFHEFGHLIDNVARFKDVFTNEVTNEKNKTWVKNQIINVDALKSIYITNDPNYRHVRARQTYSNQGPAEQWADAFANYVAGNIDLNQVNGPGQDMYKFVTDVLTKYFGP